MPYVNGVYTNPGWSNTTPPPLNSKNLNDISNALAALSISSYGKNILDNACFYSGGTKIIFPINQRGNTLYSNFGGVANQAFDRWMVDGNNITITLGGIKMLNNSILIQRIEEENWQLLSNYLLYGGNAVFSILASTGGHSYVLSRALLPFTVGPFNIQFIGSSHDIWITSTEEVFVEGVKLEIGTTQTLFYKDQIITPPNYAEELAKCQRYQYVIGYNNNVHGYGYSQTNTAGDAFIPLPVTMRTSPTISVINFPSELQSYFQTINSGTKRTPVSISSPQLFLNGISLSVSDSFGSSNLPFIIYSNITNDNMGRIVLDANL